MSQSWIRKVTMVAVLAVGSVAVAGGLVSVCGECYLPGVNSHGCLDWGKGGCLKFTGIYSCNCGTLVTIGKGSVQNCSCRSQCYTNPGLGHCVLRCLGYCGNTSCEKYSVTTGGCATYLGSFNCVSLANK